MRKYMSKSQRACDSCRARKSACRIDTVPPCRLCHLSRRECTFNAASRNTRAPAASVAHVSPDSSVQEPANPDVSNQRNDNLSSNNAFFDQHGYLLPGELPDPSADFWLDQAMVDIDMQAFNHINTSPNDTTVDHIGLPSPSTQGHETTSIVCGLTGDMDPYLMQRYNFGPDSSLVFKRLAIRSMTQHVHPVQLLVSNSVDTGSKSIHDSHSSRKQLQELVSPDVGVRLISLYGASRPTTTPLQLS